MTFLFNVLFYITWKTIDFGNYMHIIGFFERGSIYGLFDNRISSLLFINL